MKALLNGPGLPRSEPHQLVPQGDQGVLVTIVSIQGLDGCLSSIPSSFKGVISGYVLPKASYSDCLLLKAAAESGMYGVRPFTLLNKAVVVSKVAEVDEAKKALDDVVGGLNRLKTVTLRRDYTQAMGVDLTPHQLARAAESSAQWEAVVENTKLEAQFLIGSAMEQLKSIISEALESQ
jgi:hypothetical protein